MARRSAHHPACSPKQRSLGDSHLDALVERAVRAHAVPSQLAEQARVVTARRFRDEVMLHPRRVEDYFWGVVRREAFRIQSVDTSEFRRRLVAAAVAEDFRSAGFGEERVHREVAALMSA